MSSTPREIIPRHERNRPERLSRLDKYRELVEQGQPTPEDRLTPVKAKYAAEAAETPPMGGNWFDGPSVAELAERAARGNW